MAMSDAQISQADLARKLDTAWSTVARWMKGSIPRRKVIVEIADALCVASRWLECNEGPMRPGEQEAAGIAVDSVAGPGRDDPQQDAALALGIERSEAQSAGAKKELIATVRDLYAVLYALAGSGPAVSPALVKTAHERVDDFAKWLVVYRQDAARRRLNAQNGGEEEEKLKAES